jgi:uncharacterized membrane protein YqjE
MREKANINTGNDRTAGFGNTDTAPTTGFRPFSRIFQDIVDHIKEIIRSEVRLAKTEVSQDARHVLRASVVLVIGGIFALYALGFMLLAAFNALETMMTPWLAALAVGLGAGIVAAIFLGIGRRKMKQASLKPDRTIRSLQENVTWIKTQTR